MAPSSRRRLSRWAAVGCSVIVAAALLAGASAREDDLPPRFAAGSLGPLRVAQMNLCNSGIADCYTGRSVAEAAMMIRAERPEIVTLNEVCRSDVSALDATLSKIDHAGVVVSAFKAAMDRSTGAAWRCRNGEPYGIGLLAWLRSPDRGTNTLQGGVYPIQDTTDPEERVWLCLHAPAQFLACTTHLASTSRVVAMRQCQYLMQTVIPALRKGDGDDPEILGADLNLGDGQSPNAQSCVSGYLRADDGGVQDIVVSSEFTVTSTRSISMQGTTDHPDLLADLSIK
jgi:hypothetical protein